MLDTILTGLAYLWKQIRVFVVVMLCYLLQITVVSPYVRIAGCTPSLLMVMLAVVGVSFGRLRAFEWGALIGILMETMQPSRPMLNLLMYPVTALAAAAIFRDKTPEELTAERSMGKAGRNRSAFLRIPEAAAVEMVMYEVVQLSYIYMRESSLTARHFGMGLVNVLLTVGLSLLLMWPLRRVLGFRPEKHEQRARLFDENAAGRGPEAARGL